MAAAQRISVRQLKQQAQATHWMGFMLPILGAELCTQWLPCSNGILQLHVKHAAAAQTWTAAAWDASDIYKACSTWTWANTAVKQYAVACEGSCQSSFSSGQGRTSPGCAALLLKCTADLCILAVHAVSELKRGIKTCIAGLCVLLAT